MQLFGSFALFSFWADVNAIINMMLGKVEAVPAADLNGDGNVDISDVNAVINLMLGKVRLRLAQEYSRRLVLW